MNNLDHITGAVIDTAFRLHRAFGPGLLESTYEACMFHDLRKKGLHVERQKEVPIVFEGIRLDCGYRIDLLVESRVVVELKCVSRIEAVHIAQVLTYMKLSGCTVGLLINFHVALLRDGIKRLVSNYPG